MHLHLLNNTSSIAYDLTCFSQVKSSSAPFMSYLRQLVAENKLDELNLVTRDILNVFQENLNSVRLMPYIFNFLGHLLSSGCLDSVFKSMSL
jgi:hypothetical protein